MTSHGYIYEFRIDHSAGSSVVSIDAATLEEAFQRANNLWVRCEVTFLGTIDRRPQLFLVAS